MLNKNTISWELTSKWYDQKSFRHHNISNQNILFEISNRGYEVLLLRREVCGERVTAVSKFSTIYIKKSLIFSTLTTSQVPNVSNIGECIALCANEDGCVSVTHEPSRGDCWLKNKEFGNSPGDKNGVDSSNLRCRGRLYINYLIRLITYRRGFFLRENVQKLLR